MLSVREFRSQRGFAALMWILVEGCKSQALQCASARRPVMWLLHSGACAVHAAPVLQIGMEMTDGHGPGAQAPIA